MNKRSDCQKELAIKFLDASVKDDAELRLLGTLLRSCNYDFLDQESLIAAGSKIIEYLDLKVVKDHIFWGRPLISYSGSEADLKISLYAIKESIKNK